MKEEIIKRLIENGSISFHEALILLGVQIKVNTYTAENPNPYTYTAGTIYEDTRKL